MGVFSAASSWHLLSALLFFILALSISSKYLHLVQVVWAGRSNKYSVFVYISLLLLLSFIALAMQFLWWRWHFYLRKVTQFACWSYPAAHIFLSHPLLFLWDTFWPRLTHRIFSFDVISLVIGWNYCKWVHFVWLSFFYDVWFCFS